MAGAIKSKMYSTKCARCSKCSCQQNCASSKDSSLKRKSTSSKFSGSKASVASSSNLGSSSLARQSGKSSVGNVVPGLAPRKSVLGPCNQNVGQANQRSVAKRKSCPDKPFIQYCGDQPKIFTAPPVIVTEKKSTRAVTRAIRDYESSSSVRNFVAVPYGVELYDENPYDDIRISRADFETLVSKAWVISEDLKDGSRSVRKCTELNQPKFNTLKKSVKDIQDAVTKLRLIPNDIERKIKNEPSYQRQIQETVTKKLNVPSKGTMYKDLVQIDSPDAERARSTEEILKQLRSAQLPPKTRDPEPKILDFNHPTFARIRPKLPDPPAKPQSGVTLEYEEEFQLMTSEHNFTEKGSNASLFYQSMSDAKLDK